MFETLISTENPGFLNLSYAIFAQNSSLFLAKRGLSEPGILNFPLQIFCSKQGLKICVHSEGQ